MILVAGLGNPDRGDDGAGFAAAALVREAAPGGVAVVQLEGDQLALLDAWDGAAEVYVVDAVRSGGEPGNVYPFDACAPLSARFSRRGTHWLGLADVIELARALDRLPARLRGYGIEGGCFALGAPLSPAVAAAARTVAGQILRELPKRAGPPA
jgi:hydrogenase maturation protease